MAIGNIANVPGTPEEFAIWSFSHMAHHRDINRAILEQNRLVLPEYLLDPFNPDDFGLWGEQHQQMHNNQNSVLKIAGNDLSDVDWRDIGQRTSWIFLNFTEHYQASNILGV